MDTEFTTEEISEILKKLGADAYEKQSNNIITGRNLLRILNLAIVSSIVQYIIHEINKFPLHAGLITKITTEYDEVTYGKDLGLRYAVTTPPAYDRGHVGLTLVIDIVDNNYLRIILDLAQSNGWNLVSYETVIIILLCDPTCITIISDVIKCVRYFQAFNIRDDIDRWMYRVLNFMGNRGWKWCPWPSIENFEQAIYEDQMINNSVDDC